AQMSVGVSKEILLILDRLERTGAIASALEVAAPLGIEISSNDGTIEHRRAWIDLSGRTVQRTLLEEVPNVTAVDLEGRPGTARVAINSAQGPIVLDISRSRLSARNPHQFLVLIGFTAFLMSAIALIYLRNQMRPIRRLARAAEAFGKGRVVPYRVAGATEVRAAGSAFLNMRDRIERQIEQRTMMLSGVSHDLRTPLTRMKLGLSLMEEGAEVDDMRRDVADMEQMLEAFLSFARGDALEDPERIDPIALAQDAVDRFARAGLQVQARVFSGEGTAMLRPMALRRALDNLISNALRYGNEAGVSAIIDDAAIRLIVEDSGPGIPEEHHDSVLKAFTRLDSARNQDSGSGVGLGLTIAADIARQHGGKLILGKSDSLGGLRVEIAIPK
ncbi:MAG: HAMP domain-containing protein, partial [Silicimonas sp.]|nr:HAMP domain-containing protein [Silicimonas sp.]